MEHHRREATTTLQAMCRQEETHYKIAGRYLMPSDESPKVAQRRSKCRKAMVQWNINVVDYLDFSRETVTIGLNYLDRFLETEAGKACLTTPRQFKIAGMTCLYTAIKCQEPEAIEPDLVVELSGNLCDVEDIEQMERTLLAALNWHVNPPTPLAFCRSLLALVPRGVVLCEEDCTSLLDLAQVQTELAVDDSRLITVPPSLLALASIFNALESKHSSMETLDDLSQLFFVALAGSSTLDMDAVFDVQDVLDDIIRQHNNSKKNTDDASVDPSASPTTPAKEMAQAAVARSNDPKQTGSSASSTTTKFTPLPVVSPTSYEKPRHKAAEAA